MNIVTNVVAHPAMASLARDAWSLGRRSAHLDEAGRASALALLLVGRRVTSCGPLWELAADSFIMGVRQAREAIADGAA